jgi:hypothetical protein
MARTWVRGPFWLSSKKLEYFLQDRTRESVGLIQILKVIMSLGVPAWLLDPEAITVNSEEWSRGETARRVLQATLCPHASCPLIYEAWTVTGASYRALGKVTRHICEHKIGAQEGQPSHSPQSLFCDCTWEGLGPRQPSPTCPAAPGLCVELRDGTGYRELLGRHCYSSLSGLLTPPSLQLVPTEA